MFSGLHSRAALKRAMAFSREPISISISPIPARALSLAVDYLLGKQISQELLNQIDKIIKKGKYIRGYHDLQLHDYGRGKIIGSVHVEIPKNIMAENIHESIDEVEQEILKKTSVCRFVDFGFEIGINSLDRKSVV